MVPALRVRWAKPVNEREVNTQGGHGFNSRRLHLKKPSDLSVGGFLIGNEKSGMEEILAFKTGLFPKLS